MNGFTKMVARIFLGPGDGEIGDSPQTADDPARSAPRLATAPPAAPRPVDLADYERAAELIRRNSAPTVAHPAEDTMSSSEPRTATPADSDDVDIDLVEHGTTTDSGVHALDDQTAADVPTVRASCPTCRGAGFVERGVNELLRESLAMIVDGGDMVIRTFYTRLLHAAPDLAPLFPADLLTAVARDSSSPGAIQRDKLLRALVALSELYGGTVDDQARLDTALASFGRSHAAFARPGGVVYGATVDEYMAVRACLFGTLMDVAGDRWLPEYTSAWVEAYNYAMVMMLHSQYTGRMRAARYPRHDAADE